MKAIDPIKIAQQLTDFLRSAFAQAGFNQAVLALSGGVDSATSCALAVRALGESQVFPILLPYGALNSQGVLDAMTVVEKLQIPLRHVARIDIKPIVDAALSRESGTDNVRRGNVMARIRMTLLFDQAKKRTALVVGTENKTEQLLGYFTRFGDAASDLEPLHHLYKTQVYALAKYLGVPEQILSKKPTAGLWEGQTDEGEFGFSYAVADQVLNLLYDEKKTSEEVVAAGFAKEVVEKIIDRVSKNSFKHHLPIIP